MQRGVPGFRRGDFMLRADDFILAARDLGNRAFQLRLQFRNFQNRKRLPLAHPVADIHPYGANETGNLGMDVDHLVRLELTRQSQHMRNRTPLHHRHPRSGRFWSSLNFSVAMGTEDKPRGQSEDCARSNQENKTLSHIGTCTCRKIPESNRRAAGICSVASEIYSLSRVRLWLLYNSEDRRRAEEEK